MKTFDASATNKLIAFSFSSPTYNGMIILLSNTNPNTSRKEGKIMST